MRVIINGHEREFDIQKDGITFHPLVGAGYEKDLDYFLSWEELQEIFVEERDNHKFKNRNTHIMSDGEEHGTNYMNE